VRPRKASISNVLGFDTDIRQWVPQKPVGASIPYSDPSLTLAPSAVEKLCRFAHVHE